MSLDMPIRLSSTHKMLTIAPRLRAPINSFRVSQKLDLSMHEIQLTAEYWEILWDLESFSNIFVKAHWSSQGPSGVDRDDGFRNVLYSVLLASLNLIPIVQHAFRSACTQWW